MTHLNWDRVRQERHLHSGSRVDTRATAASRRTGPDEAQAWRVVTDAEVAEAHRMRPLLAKHSVSSGKLNSHTFARHR